MIVLIAVLTTVMTAPLLRWSCRRAGVDISGPGIDTTPSPLVDNI
jgi:hypothetical protein